MDGNKIISMKEEKIKEEKVERGSKFGCWNEDDQWMDVIQFLFFFCYYKKTTNNKEKIIQETNSKLKAS